jgi:hypothetical protein
LFIFSLKTWFLYFSFLSKFKFTLKVLNNIIIKKPIENSKPARANKKNVVDNNNISSFKDPERTLIVYKTAQTSSEYINIFKKLDEFNKKEKTDNQKIKFQKTNQICIIFNL